jgi:signal transduction histidine kinase
MSPLPRPDRRVVAAWQVRLPARTIRLRLTAIYGSLFLVCGGLLLATTYILVSRATDDGCYRHTTPRAGRPPLIVGACGVSRYVSSQTGVGLLIARQRAAEMHAVAFYSGIALAITAILAVGLGWIVAGRVLRPLRTITETVRDISASSLHRRLALDGPSDELKRLGDTFDALLTRLDGAFDAQRRFVANASHELRTPLTVSRALLQAAATDTRASAEELRAACHEAIEVADEQERLIEALLTLARSERGLDRREPADLAAVTSDVLATRAHDADRLGLRVQAVIEPADISGDGRLAERMAGNLIDNALRHNVPGGTIQVTTGTRAGRAFLAVANTGPAVAPGEVHRLLEPFQRGDSGQPRGDAGLGLGLSIVQAVAAAHDATLTASPRPGGGLDVTVSFPPPKTSPMRAATRGTASGVVLAAGAGG